MRRLLIIVATVAALSAGCGAPTDVAAPLPEESASPIAAPDRTTTATAPPTTVTRPPTTTNPGQVVYDDIDSLVEAADDRFSVDGAYEGRQVERIALPGQPEQTISTRLTVELDDGEPTRRVVLQTQTAGLNPTITEFVLTPDDSYALIDQSLRPPTGPQWLRLDPARGDPVSAQLMEFADAQRDPPEGTCLSAAGATDIIDTAQDEVDGLDTIRYDLVIEVDPDSATAPDLARNLLDAGAVEIESSVWVDEDDRVRRCVSELSLADGGEYTLEQNTISQGEPVSISVPDRSDVVRLPSE